MTKAARILSELKRNPHRGGKQIAHAAGDDVTVKSVSAVAVQHGIAYGNRLRPLVEVRMDTKHIQAVGRRAAALGCSFSDALGELLGQAIAERPGVGKSRSRATA